MDLGWVKLYRSSFNNSLYFSEEFTKWQAWVDLLLLANHKDSVITKRGIKVIVERGQVGHSEYTLAERWKWSRGKVRRFIQELKKEHQIEHQKTNITTLITILNYREYQDIETNISDYGSVKVQTGTEKIQTDNKLGESFMVSKYMDKSPSFFINNENQ